ncbi:MAG: ATP-binding cassette domain-containing protein [Bifidobacteriaceae bacterium]|nr:ATP-binding cassette domain-containing protein [Bifidobacteriaceae bacterium]
MIQIEHLTKRFGSLTAVDDLSFTVADGRITGFLGPNGSGKTTTLRASLGLIKANEGRVTFDGVPYKAIAKPLRTIGAALEASSFHPGRTALDHLRVLGTEAGVSTARCREVLELVGLAAQGNRRVGGFSMGMRARLALAAALLGDPGILLLDEPTNGLDPEGISWMRSLLRALAAQGRTILVSSHLLAEVEQTADDVVIIARGKLLRAAPLSELQRSTGATTIVDALDGAGLAKLISTKGWDAVQISPSAWRVTGPTAAQIGQTAMEARLVLTQLASQQAGLEQVFFELTEGGGLA